MSKSRNKMLNKISNTTKTISRTKKNNFIDDKSKKRENYNDKKNLFYFIKYYSKKTWYFLWKDDSIWSWIASLLIAFILIKFIIYPVIGLVLGTQFPIVAVVSGSMTHDGSFDNWWALQEDFYLQKNITKEEFLNFPFKNGFNKGDIMILKGINIDKLKIGDILVFWSNQPYPIIHRIVEIDNESYKKSYKQINKNNNNINNEISDNINDFEGSELIFQTKGDHNRGQSANIFFDETHIKKDKIVGSAIFRIPFLGYVKIWFTNLIKLII